MIVPRSFRHSATSPMEPFDEKKDIRRSVRRRETPQSRMTSAPRPPSPVRTVTEPVRTPTKPVSVPTPERPYSAESQNMATATKPRPSMRRKPSNHDPNALPPSVAALLAVTEIPRPKKGQFNRRRSATPRRISLDELVNEWKNDENIISSYGSSPGLSALLEDPDIEEEQCPSRAESVPEGFLHMRSISAESVPSLEADDRSIVSNESLSTPESLRSRKSIPNLKREKSSRSLPAAEECSLDHPLVPQLPEDEDPDDSLILAPSKSNSVTPKPKSSFKSNLTSSLQALKNAAISSLSTFTGSSAQSRTPSSPMPDDVLWSHPYLFPRFSSEVRPAISDTPTKAQRRYLNPMPLTFEEQEAPFQAALHAPYLAERVAEAPYIQMRTYNSRSKRKSAVNRGPNPNSEAGRALLGAAGVRQREPRENTDFLRMIVCEMNMKRSGKLAYGRAKIMLPPRRVGPATDEEMCDKVPRRWVGESAY